ncbi:MAG TPA: tetraacyldisaccharide 4'-kinase [Abditibacteriaceae bacterium]|jgi:tetraacyldisaccharide 4'-kinase
MLGAAEALYRVLLERRRRKWTRGTATTFAGCQVLSVGNLTTGGTGKTPAVQWLARRLQADGAKVAVVARGYGGQLSAAGAVVSDGQQTFVNATQAGDEPLLHARSLPGVVVIIGRDRVAAVQRAIDDFGVDTVILDDGFQFWSLQRDLDLVLLDARRPLGNGHLLPRGRLREPPESLMRADAILLTRADVATQAQRDAARRLVARYTQAPVFEASHAPLALRDERTATEQPLTALHGARVFAVSALADNSAFAATLQKSGAQAQRHVARRDHHRWTKSEIKRVLTDAASSDAMVVTTEKDAVKWQPAWLHDEQAVTVWSLRIKLKMLPDDEAFCEWLRGALKRV